MSGAGSSPGSAFREPRRAGVRTTDVASPMDRPPRSSLIGSHGEEAVLIAQARARRARRAARRALPPLRSTLYGLGLRLPGRSRACGGARAGDVRASLALRASASSPRRGTARAFVFTLARRAGVDLLRRRSSGSTPAIALEDLDTTRGDDAFDELVLSLDVRDVLDRLSPKHREVLELHYFGDMTQVADRCRLERTARHGQDADFPRAARVPRAADGDRNSCERPPRPPRRRRRLPARQPDAGRASGFRAAPRRLRFVQDSDTWAERAGRPLAPSRSRVRAAARARGEGGSDAVERGQRRERRIPVAVAALAPCGAARSCLSRRPRPPSRRCS